MKTGYMEYDTINKSSTEIETNLIASGDIIVIKEDCGIYNIMFRKPLFNDKNKVCGNVYVHAPNCTLRDDGKYIVHGADESRTTIAYHQLCDLAHVPYDASCCDLFKALNKTIYPDGYKPNPNRAERRGKK